MENKAQDEPLSGEVVLRPPPLPPIRAVDWRSTRQAQRERFETEVRVVYGGEITERAQDSLERVRTKLAHQIASSGRAPDDLDTLLVQNYGFGAAELIRQYMNRPRCQQ